jgi:iron complex outermembrane receptor protein
MLRCANSTKFNVNNPVYGRLPVCTTVRAVDSDQTEELSTVSIYMQDALHLNDQWIAVGGLRYQYYDIYAGKGRPFVINTENTGGELIPNAGLVYKLTPDASLYANVAKTSVRNPRSAPIMAGSIRKKGFPMKSVLNSTSSPD